MSKFPDYYYFELQLRAYNNKRTFAVYFKNAKALRGFINTRNLKISDGDMASVRNETMA